MIDNEVPHLLIRMIKVLLLYLTKAIAMLVILTYIKMIPLCVKIQVINRMKTAEYQT
jgi:hypothetical protein